MEHYSESIMTVCVPVYKQLVQLKWLQIFYFLCPSPITKVYYLWVHEKTVTQYLIETLLCAFQLQKLKSLITCFFKKKKPSTSLLVGTSCCPTMLIHWKANHGFITNLLFVFIENTNQMFSGVGESFAAKKTENN